MSTVAPLHDERGEDLWTVFEACRGQFKRERRSGSITMQVHVKRGIETKAMLTPLQVSYMAGEDDDR